MDLNSSVYLYNYGDVTRYRLRLNYGFNLKLVLSLKELTIKKDISIFSAMMRAVLDFIKNKKTRSRMKGMSCLKVM